MDRRRREGGQGGHLGHLERVDHRLASLSYEADLQSAVRDTHPLDRPGSGQSWSASFAPRIDTAELDVIGRDIKDSLARSSDRTIQAGIVVRLREVQQDSIGAVRDFEVVAAEVVPLVTIEFVITRVSDHYVCTPLDDTPVNCILTVNFGKGRVAHPLIATRIRVVSGDPQPSARRS